MTGQVYFSEKKIIILYGATREELYILQIIEFFLMAVAKEKQSPFNERNGKENILVKRAIVHFSNAKPPGVQRYQLSR